MGHPGRLIASAIVSLALVASSTTAVASTVPPQAPPTNGWMTLSMLTPSGAAVLGSSGVAAAQPTPPPMVTCPDGTVVPAGSNCPGAGPGWPPLPVILIWLAVIGVDIWILTRHHHHGIPNSPA